MRALTSSEAALINEQIRKNHAEITFQLIIFSVANSLSMLFIGYIMYRCVFFNVYLKEDYSKFLAGAISLLVPYLTYVGQGLSYPKKRRIAVLSHLLLKTDITNDDVKCIYEK